MKMHLLIFLFLAALCPQVNAQNCPDLAPFDKAREIIRDLDRITAPAGIQESYKIKIGGINQWVNIRGQDKTNPVILFIHGGPASPNTPALWQFQRPLEEYFTVVNYDQRGAGKTYLETDPKGIINSISIDRYVDDAIEIAEYVRKRYGKEKVILVGHSWGTVVGMKAALKRPKLFYAYVGIGQVINTRDNERISFDYGLEQAKLHENATAIAELESISPYPGNQPITSERIIIARKWAQFYGGLSAFRNDSKYLFDAAKLSPDYEHNDVCAIDKGSMLTLGKILPELLDVDFKGVGAFPIPVVMFMGRHDFTTPSALTSAWLDHVKAPYKRAVWFERSAHSVPWEEPGKMLVSLLKYVRPLAPNADDAHGK